MRIVRASELRKEHRVEAGGRPLGDYDDYVDPMRIMIILDDFDDDQHVLVLKMTNMIIIFIIVIFKSSTC